MVYYCWVWGLLILDNYMIMLYCSCLRVLNRILSPGHLYNLVVVTSSLSVFCLCRYFLYFFITGNAGSSSNITSFNNSVICSVDFAGRTLLIGGINPLSGGGGGVPQLAGLAVTKDAGTFVTDSCCVFEVEG